MSKTKYTPIPDSTTTTKLVLKNSKRSSLIISSNSTATLYIGYDRQPTSTDYSFLLGTNDTLMTNYQGAVFGVWSSDTSGQANVTEELETNIVIIDKVNTLLNRVAVTTSLAANSAVNVAQINGVTTTMGNGVAGTGVQRVTIASDSTANIATIGTSVTPGTAATHLGKAEDAAHTSADVGVMALTVRSDTAAATAGTTGDYQPQITDATGLTWMREYYAPGYEDNTNNVAKVEQRFSYLNIAAGQATTTVKSGAGFLHSITFNSAATATNTTTVYDNTAASGTVIAIPAATTATVPTTLTYDCSFSIGLTIITATANGSNMTISYR